MVNNGAYKSKELDLKDAQIACEYTIQLNAFEGKQLEFFGSIKKIAEE